MTNIEELLQAAEVTDNADDELSYIIDEHLRVIAVPERGVVLGVEGDKDVNRVRFRINRYYHGSDFSEFTIRINYENADGDRNYFTVSERTVDEDQLDFIWTVASDATSIKGTVRFVVNCFTTSDNGIVKKAYHTTIGTAQVLEGLEVEAGKDTPEVADLLTQLEHDLTVHAGTLIEKAETAASNAERSAESAKQSADNAAASVKAAKASETNSATSATAAKKSEESTAKMLSGLVADYNGGCLGLYQVTLPADSWTKDDSGTFICTATLEECKAAYMPMAAVLKEDIYAAQDASMSEICESMDGKMQFSAASKPAKDLHVQIALLVPDLKLKG